MDQLFAIDELVFSDAIDLFLDAPLSLACSRLKWIDFDAVAGNNSTGIETSPNEMLVREIARRGI